MFEDLARSRRDTKVERTVSLTPDQAKQFQQAIRRTAVVKEMVQETLYELLNTLAERNDATWDELARMAGYGDLLMVQAAGRQLRLDYATGVLEVRVPLDDVEAIKASVAAAAEGGTDAD